MIYQEKSVLELREIAKERNMKGISALKKKELIEALEEYDKKTEPEEEWGQGVSEKYKEFGQRRKSQWYFGSYAGWIWFYPM